MMIPDPDEEILKRNQLKDRRNSLTCKLNSMVKRFCSKTGRLTPPIRLEVTQAEMPGRSSCLEEIFPYPSVKKIVHRKSSSKKISICTFLSLQSWLLPLLGSSKG